MYLSRKSGGTRFSTARQEIKLITLSRRNLRDWLLAWSIELFFLTLLLIGGLGVVSALIAKVSFCPDDPGEDFWTGCSAEMLGFCLGGAALGVLISLRTAFLLRR